MRILKHRTDPIGENAYGIVSVALLLGILIGAVCVPPVFDQRGTAPVFAMEDANSETEPVGEALDFADLYAEDAESLHAAYLQRMQIPQGDDETLVIGLNSLTHHGASWGLRNGRVDFICLRDTPQQATLGQPDPHKAQQGPNFKRSLDEFELAHIPALNSEKSVHLEMVGGKLRMLGLIATAPDDDKNGTKDNAAFGVLSYHFTEIADD